MRAGFPREGASILPLALLRSRNSLRDLHDILERSQVGRELGLKLLFVRAELAVEVFPVGAGAHGSAEDGLDQRSSVVGLEGEAVGVAERVGELLGRLGNVLAERDGR